MQTYVTYFGMLSFLKLTQHYLLCCVLFLCSDFGNPSIETAILSTCLDSITLPNPWSSTSEPGWVCDHSKVICFIQWDDKRWCSIWFSWYTNAFGGISLQIKRLMPPCCEEAQATCRGHWDLNSVVQLASLAIVRSTIRHEILVSWYTCRRFQTVGCFHLTSHSCRSPPSWNST